jgi:hypothetical protein
MKKKIYVVERYFYGEKIQLGFSINKNSAKDFIKNTGLTDAWITSYPLTKHFQKFPE